MYKRNIKPLKEFLRSSPSRGGYFVDCGFGDLRYVSKDVAGTIRARFDDGSTLLVEVYESEESVSDIQE
jgi:hypothetical protein